MRILGRLQCESGKIIYQLGLHPAAMLLLLPAARSGVTEAQMIVGFSYVSGKGVTRRARIERRCFLSIG